MGADDADTIIEEILEGVYDAISEQLGEKLDEARGEIVEALFSGAQSDVSSDLPGCGADDAEGNDETQVDGLPVRVALAWSILLAQHRDNFDVPHTIHRAAVDAVTNYMEGARSE